MAESKKRKSNFLIQGSILAFASIISRIIGLVYRVPMTNIFGDMGLDYYCSAYDIYNVMLIISSYSLPLAVSKLVSSYMAKGQKRMAFQVFKGALLFAIVSGTLVTAIVFFGADFFATVALKTPFAVFALKVLAPALVVVAILGVIRGFFQGLGTMIPSAISQIIEQIVNAIVSVVAAYYLYQYGAKVGGILGDVKHYAPAYSAAGGTLGTNLGSVAALLFVLFVFSLYYSGFKKRMKRERNAQMEPFSKTMKLLIVTIVPVLLSTTIYNISASIDNVLFKNIAFLQGYPKDQVSDLWGVFAGKYLLLINIPIAIASSLAASSVPAISAAYAENNMDEVKSQLNAATRFIMIIAFPCFVGLAVLSKPIIRLLFASTLDSLDSASSMMWVGAIAVVFFSLSTLSNGLLQGINKMRLPVIHAAVSLVFHIILLIILMLIFRLNIYAVVISNACFGLMMCILNERALVRYSGYQIDIIKTFAIPAICSVIMGALTYFTYHGVHAVIHSNTFCTFFAMIVAVVVYGVSMLLLKGIGEAELLRFPKGRMLVQLAKKCRLLK